MGRARGACGEVVVGGASSQRRAVHMERIPIREIYQSVEYIGLFIKDDSAEQRARGVLFGEAWRLCVGWWQWGDLLVQE